MNSLVLVSIAALCLAASYIIRKRRERKPLLHPILHPVNPVSEKYNWDLTPPLTIRPFYPKYEVRMNIAKIPSEEWLHIDSEYLKQTNLYEQILTEHQDETAYANPSEQTTAAVLELYRFVFSHMLKRYPSIFRLRGDRIFNTVRNQWIPMGPEILKESPAQLLRTLSTHTQEDYMLLEPDDQLEEYVMRATSGVTSVHFLWKDKVDLAMSEIHEPVPHYEERLQNPMNKAFARLRPGQFFVRNAWLVQPGSRYDIFHPVNPMSEHMPPASEIDFENGLFARVDRQVLTKLPMTGFIVMTQHNYMNSFADIRRDGQGELLSDMIDTMSDATASYRGRHVWGPTSTAYLRSKPEQVTPEKPVEIPHEVVSAA